MVGGMKDIARGAGWAVTDERSYEDQEFQNSLDASTIYSLIENEIL